MQPADEAPLCLPQGPFLWWQQHGRRVRCAGGGLACGGAVNHQVGGVVQGAWHPPLMVSRGHPATCAIHLLYV